MSGDLTVEPYLLPSPGEMPDALVDWDIRPQQATLLIHDMQRYFLSPFPERCVRRSWAMCAICIPGRSGQGRPRLTPRSRAG